MDKEVTIGFDKHHARLYRQGAEPVLFFNKQVLDFHMASNGGVFLHSAFKKSSS
jgi:hypothetical protein